MWWSGALWLKYGTCLEMVLTVQPNGDVSGVVGCKILGPKRVIWAESVDSISDSTEIVIGLACLGVMCGVGREGDLCEHPQK